MLLNSIQINKAVVSFFTSKSTFKDFESGALNLFGESVVLYNTPTYLQTTNAFRQKSVRKEAIENHTTMK